MKFSTRRGRPRKIREINDKGTQELIAKRKVSLTTEPLDLCLEKGLINIKQHDAGLHLRWLHMLKLGSPTVSAYNPDNTGGLSCKKEDIGWMNRRQYEYARLMQELAKNKVQRITVDVCIFSHTPFFLHAGQAGKARQNSLAYEQLTTLIHGLDIIAVSLKKKKNKK